MQVDDSITICIFDKEVSSLLNCWGRRAIQVVGLKYCHLQRRTLEPLREFRQRNHLKPSSIRTPDEETTEPRNVIKNFLQLFVPGQKLNSGLKYRRLELRVGTII